MSADNTVIVFILPNHKFFVCEVQAYDGSVFMKTQNIDPLWHVEHLLHAKRFNTLAKASEAAHAIDDDHYVEYGVIHVHLEYSVRDLIDMIEPSYFQKIIGVASINETEPLTELRTKAIYTDQALQSLTSALRALALAL